METDVIGGFEIAEPNCKGCGSVLFVENAWMADGCPCNHELGINSRNETRWRLLMQLQQKQQHQLEYEKNLNRLRQEAGISAAMLRDGRAKRMMDAFQQNVRLQDLRRAWKHAVRAFNYCENEGLKDSGDGLALVVAKLSQQLEFAESTS